MSLDQPLLPTTTGDRSPIGQPDSQPKAVLPAADTAGSATPVGNGTPTAPPKPFGRMTENEKARYLAGVMNDSAGTLKANGVSKHMEQMLAGVMMNEGGTNTRRVALNKYMNNMMTGGKTGGVLGQLEKAGGVEKLKADPAALAKLQKGMSEDQRFLLNRAMSGEIDIAGLKSKDKDQARAARNQVTEAGIDLRTQQYDEMTSLQARQKKGEKLTKEEQARLTQISNIGGSAMGFDSLDRRKGVDAKMADTRGLSSGRFREIYEDSQQRFEPVHYRQWRDGYEKQTADNAKLPADKQKAITLKSGIGNHTLTDKDKTSLGQNMDLLADINTSYGAAQVMGLYAHNGEMKAKDATGKPIEFSVDKLKAAGRRENPNEEDLQLLLGELGSKGMDMGSKTLSPEIMTDKYNGDRKTNKNWATYVKRLKHNMGAYQRAEPEVDAEAARSPNRHFAE